MHERDACDRRWDIDVEPLGAAGVRWERTLDHCAVFRTPTSDAGRYCRFVSEHDPIEELSELFLVLADNDFTGYCPVYEELARSIATDRELLEKILSAASPNSRRGRLPVLFFAATHDLALAVPSSDLAKVYRGASEVDPYSAFRSLVDREWSTIAHTMGTRSVQTNEVGRSAIVAIASERALPAGETDIDLFEIGPSAGLNLFFDRFAIDYLREEELVATIGPVESTVRLQCELRGAFGPPLPSNRLRVRERSGIDPNPIDVRSETECRWLQACVWPGIPDRPQRLVAALGIARSDPPSLIKGDAVDGLADALTRVQDTAHLVVLSTWALAYIGNEGRERILGTVDARGHERDLDLVTFEEPRFTPWLDPVDPHVFDRYRGEGTPTVLGIRSWRSGQCTTTTLAVAHPHGRWIHWLEENHG